MPGGKKLLPRMVEWNFLESLCYVWLQENT